MTFRTDIGPTTCRAFAVALAFGMAPSAVQAQAPDTCNRAPMEEVIGQTSFFAMNVVYEIAAYAPEQIVRILRPGEDPGVARPTRMTIYLDSDGRVREVRCD